ARRDARDLHDECGWQRPNPPHDELRERLRPSLVARRLADRVLERPGAEDLSPVHDELGRDRRDPADPRERHRRIPRLAGDLLSRSGTSPRGWSTWGDVSEFTSSTGLAHTLEDGNPRGDREAR